MVNLFLLLLSQPLGGGVDFGHPVHREPVERLKGVAGEGLADGRSHLQVAIFSEIILRPAYSFFTAKALL